MKYWQSWLLLKIPENEFSAAEQQKQERRLAALRAEVDELLALPDVPGRNTQDQEMATPHLPENQVSFFILLEADAQNLRLW